MTVPAVAPYDAVLLLSFGGPEQPADVLPFLENVTRGRGIPRSEGRCAATGRAETLGRPLGGWRRRVAFRE